MNHKRSTDADLPLGREGQEGQPLGSEARPAPFDPGKTQPPFYEQSVAASEHESNLPESVNALDAYRKLQGSGGGY